MKPAVRACDAQDIVRILEIVNHAAVAYKGVIPPDCWHEPYMTLEELRRDIAAGVAFLGAEFEGTLIGVMGVQRVRDVDLIRHAYVDPEFQRGGIGALLLRHLLDGTSRRVLVGTWADAAWAIAFYQRHGFALVDAEEGTRLLGSYWQIPEWQSNASVVLARSITD